MNDSIREYEFSKEEISIGLHLLVEKTSKIAIASQILDPWITGQTGLVSSHKTIPLIIVLEHVEHFVFGQLHRLFFDRSKNNKTASIQEIYRQVEVFAKSNTLPGTRHLPVFKKVEHQLADVRKVHGRKLKLFSNKYYAHMDIRTPEQRVDDRRIYTTFWSDVLRLIDIAKDAISSIQLYWEDANSEFAEGYYEDFKKKFWDRIDVPDPDSPKSYM